MLRNSLLSGFAFLLIAGGAFGEAAGEAKGILEINGAKVTINHVYAMQHNNEEGFLDSAELRILLCDREVDPAPLGELILAELDSMARQKKIRGLILKLDPAKEPREVYGTVLEAPASEQTSLPFFTQSGDGTSIKKLEIKDGVVSGELEETPSEDNFFEDMAKYGYKISFSAPIRANAPVTAHLKGEEAAKSPQAQAVMAYEKACREGRLDEAAKLATPAKYQELKKAYDMMGRDVFLQQMALFIPENADSQSQVTDVVVRGNKAIVITREKDGRTSASLISEGGVWKAN